MVADWHALTTDYQKPADIESNVEEMVLDWIAAGIDPERSVIFRQSWVPAHAELALILSMLTPLSWLERNPTYKDQVLELKDKEISTHGFLGYPVLQASDILLYNATHVPVGEDQLPHLELTREIARRFNFLYKKPVLREPQALLSPTPKLLGSDGRKMSKSYGNTVNLSEPEPELRKKIQSMFTDPTRIRATDPGHPRACPENPTGCVVFSLHETFAGSKDKVSKIEADCKAGTLGCSACKKDLLSGLDSVLKPLRDKRAALSKGSVQDILTAGSRKASETAGRTLEVVREAIGFAPSLVPQP
jgi:tryptophanyl-tRNA synthetase